MGTDEDMKGQYKTLSRAFACARCDKPIHDVPGEQSHWIVEDEKTGEKWGPYHKECMYLSWPEMKGQSDV